MPADDNNEKNLPPETMKKILLSSTILGCLVTLLMLIAYGAEWYPLEMIEYKLYDLRLNLIHTTTTSPVVLVGIDEASIRKLGPWPWPRAYIAVAINRLHEYNARVVGVNILYAQRDLNPGLAAIKDILNRIKAESLGKKRDRIVEILAALQEAEKKLDNDALLESAISSAKNVVLPILFTFNGQKNSDAADDNSGPLKKNSLGASFAIPPMAHEVLMPVPDFAGQALALGHINRFPDRDGVVRSEPLFITHQGHLYPSFALQLMLHFNGHDINKVGIEKHALQAGAQTIPMYKTNRLLMNFSDTTPFSYYSFSDVISGTIPAERFTDKIVLIGYSSRQSGPLLRTPLTTMPDITVAAQVVDALLNKTYIARPRWAVPLETAFFLLWGAVLTIVIPRTRTSTGAIVLFILLAAWTALSLYLFVSYRYWLILSYVIALTVAGYIVLLVQNSFTRNVNEEIQDADIIENNEIKLVASARTDTGRAREHNEDSFCIDRAVGLLAVADGVGGQASGEVASNMALDALREYLKRAEADQKQPDNYTNSYSKDTYILGEAVKHANTILFEAAQRTPQWRKMGTTIAAALLRGNKLSIAHVGDSRIYLARAHHIEQLTDDHSLAQPGMKHVLTKALGINAEVAVDLGELTLSEGDAVVLCTDGLNTMVDDRAILSTVTSGKDPFTTCTRLVTIANKNGGHDNVTAIVAYAYKRGEAL